jgi:hypothetical protein
MMYLLGVHVFGIVPGEMPGWATPVEPAAP